MMIGCCSSKALPSICRASATSTLGSALCLLLDVVSALSGPSLRPLHAQSLTVGRTERFTSSRLALACRCTRRVNNLVGGWHHMYDTCPRVFVLIAVKLIPHARATRTALSINLKMCRAELAAQRCSRR
jgi:hypothetical protein